MDGERVLRTEPPKPRYALGAAVSIALALGSTVWAYAEYVGSARAPLLALALAGVFFGIAGATLFGIRSTFSLTLVEAPRPKPPPAELPVDLGTGTLSAGTRRALVALLCAATASVLAIVLLPLRSLGGSPRSTLRATSWRRGLRLVTQDGRPLRPMDLVPGSTTPVVPDGAPDDARAVAVLVRLRDSAGVRAYSRMCTHAGCAVSVFRSDESQLICPCHYSVFAADAGGRVLSGPASGPLPELPLGVDDEGFLIAEGDFNRPIGPRGG
jgi:ubiquinol-cytochrome c reductase iron-sulfur subunit